MIENGAWVTEEKLSGLAVMPTARRFPMHNSMFDGGIITRDLSIVILHLVFGGNRQRRI